VRIDAMRKVILALLAPAILIPTTSTAVTVRGTPSCDLLKGTDNDPLAIWVCNYCRAHPLDDLHEAGMPLALELIKWMGP
jgi:hypothetical protein